MKTQFRRLLRTFLAGLLAALPLAATFLVILWLGSLLFALLGPNSLVGTLLVSLGLGVTGSVWLSYLIGAGLVGLGIFGLGVLVETGVQRGMSTVIASALQRIPLVRSIYDLSSRVVELMARREPGKDGLRSMSPVWCHFGGPGGAAVLALLSTHQPLMVEGRAYHAVLVPTAPVPIGGGLLYVPQEWVTPADIGVEALTSIYVSMGVTSPQHLNPAPAAATVSPVTSVTPQAGT